MSRQNVEAAIAAIADGEFVLVVDDEDRENEAHQSIEMPDAEGEQNHTNHEAGQGRPEEVSFQPFQ